MAFSLCVLLDQTGFKLILRVKNSSCDKSGDFLGSTMNEHGSWHLPLRGSVSILISFNLKWFEPQRKSVRVKCIRAAPAVLLYLGREPWAACVYTAWSAFVNWVALIIVKSIKWRPQFHKVYANVITFQRDMVSRDMNTHTFLLFWGTGKRDEYD